MSRRQVPEAIVVGSGKGGVGKSVTSIAVAAELAAQGRRVLLLDGDQNLGSLHVMLGVTPVLSLEALIDTAVPPDALTTPVADNLWLLPSDSGSETLYGLGATDRARLQRRLSGLFDRYDVTVIDAGAGLESVIRCAAMRATRLLLVTTPDPSALSDAYALVKITSLQVGPMPIDVLVNRTRDEEEGRARFDRLAAAAERFLRRGLRYLGAVPEDAGMRDVLENPARLLASDGSSRALRAIRHLTATRLELSPLLRLAAVETSGEVS
jgi:flagellar biosynthesis protein FlhG